MRVTVIGAGIIGLSIAYRLAGRGCEVTVVNRTETHSGASNNNAGWLVPGDCGPVPAPGIVLQTMRWMLQQGSPLYVRPSLQPDYLRFLVGMLRACNATAYRNAVDALLRLAAGTMEEFDAWAADGISCEMHKAGELRAFLTDEEFHAVFGGLDQLRRAGVEIEVLDGNGARDLVPELSDEVAHAIFFPTHRHVQPETIIDGLVSRCHALGVRFVGGSIDQVTVRPSGAIELRGTAEPVEADSCVVAAGVWSRQVTRLFGVPLPIHAGKGYSLDYAPSPLPATRPNIMLCEAHCAVTPLDGATRVAGTMEFGSLDETVNDARVRAIRTAPRRYLRDWNPDASASTPTAGLRPMTSDGLPVIGRLGQHRNVFVASGHGMLGLTLAPRTAVEVVHMVVDGQAPEVLAPFSPSRFA
jgi:D-amino-acid dehydrogenase